MGIPHNCKVYVTYGFGSNLAGCFSIVEGESWEACNKIIEEVTKMQFAFRYTERDFLNNNMQGKYGLVQVDLQPQIRVNREVRERSEP
jgi:hypothetical protein